MMMTAFDAQQILLQFFRLATGGAEGTNFSQRNWGKSSKRICCQTFEKV